MLFPTLPLPDLKTLLPSGKPGVEEAGGAPDASGRRAVEPQPFCIMLMLAITSALVPVSSPCLWRQ